MHNTLLHIKLHNPRYTGFIASLIFTIAALITCLTNSVFTSICPRHYTVSGNTFDTIGNKKAINCTTDTLYYSGYDYYVHGKVVAHYYYSLNDNTCTIFLINNRLSGGSSPQLTLGSQTFSANIRHGDTYLRQLLEYMSSDLDWNYYSLSKYTNSYIISQYHYNLPWLIMMISLTVISTCLTIYFYVTFKKEHNHHQKSRQGI